MPKKKTSTASPVTIHYYPQGSTTLTALPIEQLVAVSGMQAWTEMPLPPIGEIWPATLQKALQSLLQQSLKTQQKLALVHMPHPLENQLEVVALQAIAKGEVIIYSGQYAQSLIDTRDPYAYGIDGDSVVTAKHQGNLARFLSHAPDHSSLDRDLEFDSSASKARVATANFTASELTVAGVRIYCLAAKQAIEPGQRLYWNYGSTYFRAMGVIPLLFDKTNGQMMPDCHYHYKNPLACFEGKQGDALFPMAHIQDVIRRDGYISMAQPYYETVYHASYWQAWLTRHPNFSKGPFVKDSIAYDEHPGIKRLPLNTDLRQVSLKMLQEILADSWPTTPWQDGQYAILDETGETEKSMSYESVYVSVEAAKAMHHVLSAAGFSLNVDYLINPSDSGLCQFRVSQSGLFQRLASTPDYYADVASARFQLENLPVKWLSQAIKDNIWLTLNLKDCANPAVALQALQALKDYINQYCESQSIARRADYQIPAGNKAKVSVPVSVFPAIPAFRWPPVEALSSNLATLASTTTTASSASASALQVRSESRDQYTA